MLGGAVEVAQGHAHGGHRLYRQRVRLDDDHRDGLPRCRRAYGGTLRRGMRRYQSRAGEQQHGESGHRLEDAGGIQAGLKERVRGVPDGIRTRVTAVKGRCPRPLDDGDAKRR